MTTQLRTALYAGVSTRDKGQDTNVQLRELREYCERRGWTIAHEYVDSGVSGAKESRPALNQLMTDAKRRKFDAVVVFKLDRFGRSLKHLVNSLAEFDAVGVAFVSMSDNLDLTTPQGRLMFNIIGAMAEFERSLISERTRAGIAYARSKGKRIGRPLSRVDEAKAIALRHGGLSVRKIASELQISVGKAHQVINRYDPAAIS